MLAPCLRQHPKSAHQSHTFLSVYVQVLRGMEIRAATLCAVLALVLTGIVKLASVALRPVLGL